MIGGWNMRKNNRNDMTIAEQMISIIEDICTNYCKYPNQFDSDDPEQEKQFNEICENCPLGRIGV